LAVSLGGFMLLAWIDVTSLCMWKRRGYARYVNIAALVSGHEVEMEELCLQCNTLIISATSVLNNLKTQFCDNS
jgi:hypothetical protein